ncbi:hypothetical protein SH2C18_44640 [Clostridium sediminicola]|uniref:rhodanese-like domain-containing protein n=1 Tax=Clostridium sediminicola TaxID=3114879 RepID=UPI0031F1DA98
MKKTMNITAAILASILTIGSLGISVFAEPQGNGDAKKENGINITEKRDKNRQDKNRQNNCKRISPLKAKEMLQKDGNIILLDVRTPEEYAEKRIPNSVNLPIDDLGEKASEVLSDKNATIIVYCKLGKRSKRATRILCKMGYTNVYNLGGIQDWPYETEKN